PLSRVEIRLYSSEEGLSRVLVGFPQTRLSDLVLDASPHVVDPRLQGATSERHSRVEQRASERVATNEIGESHVGAPKEHVCRRPEEEFRVRHTVHGCNLASPPPEDGPGSLIASELATVLSDISNNLSLQSVLASRVVACVLLPTSRTGVVRCDLVVVDGSVVVAEDLADQRILKVSTLEVLEALLLVRVDGADHPVELRVQHRLKYVRVCGRWQGDEL